MPILPSDIKLLESERMRDTPDGGGRMTGNVIVSGEMSNVFPKVSRSDAVYGRVNFRKIYLAVKTATLEMYAGAMTVVMKPPGNDLISVAVFSTNSFFDSRTAARDRVESYVVQGPLSRMRVYGDQLIGQKAITVYQRDDEPLPEVGEVIVLSVEKSGFTPASQYVRIVDFEHEIRTFEDDKGTFTRRVLMLRIGSTLSQTFPGAEVTRYSTDPAATKVRVTQVADASKYYGIAPLALAAEPGDLTATLTTMFAPLVPSTQRETGVSLASVVGATYFEKSSAAATVQVSTRSDEVTSLFDGVVPMDFVPGSLILNFWVYFGILAQNFRLADNGAGDLLEQASGVKFGTIDYPTRTWTIDGGVRRSIPDDNRNYIIFTPLVEVSTAAHTKQIPITLATRGTVYVETLNPPPAPGTTILDYRVYGKWYRLRDNGQGQLVGNQPSEGTGSVNYVTGAVVATLGALPDVDSGVLLSWGTPAHFEIGQQANASAVAWQGVLQNLPIEPGTVQFEWYDGATQRLVTDNGDGRLMGAGEGRINYVNGQYWFQPTTMPAPGATPVVAYEAGALDYQDFTPTKDGNGFVTVTIADAPLVPKSVLVEWETVRTLTQQEKSRKVVGYN